MNKTLAVLLPLLIATIVVVVVLSVLLSTRKKCKPPTPVPVPVCTGQHIECDQNQKCQIQYPTNGGLVYRYTYDGNPDPRYIGLLNYDDADNSIPMTLSGLNFDGIRADIATDFDLHQIRNSGISPFGDSMGWFFNTRQIDFLRNPNSTTTPAMDYGSVSGNMPTTDIRQNQFWVSIHSMDVPRNPLLGSTPLFLLL